MEFKEYFGIKRPTEDVVFKKITLEEKNKKINLTNCHKTIWDQEIKYMKKFDNKNIIYNKISEDVGVPYMKIENMLDNISDKLKEKYYYNVF